jgi:hypothetical protein
MLRGGFAGSASARMRIDRRSGTGPSDNPGHCRVHLCPRALASIDLAASGELTRRELNWNPTGPDLLTDLRGMNYVA